MKRIFGMLFLVAAVAQAEPFKDASPESLKQATQQMNALSKAMTDGVAILKRGEPVAISAHSKHFSALVASGESQFGTTIFEPLGSCGIAGNFSRTWWNAHLFAAYKGGIEQRPGSIKDALSEFQAKRDDCLQSADPVIAAKAEAESDAALKKKFGGGRECLTVFTVDPETKDLVEKPKPAHCKS